MSWQTRKQTNDRLNGIGNVIYGAFVRIHVCDAAPQFCIFQLCAMQCTVRHAADHYVNTRVWYSMLILYTSMMCHAVLCKIHWQLLCEYMCVMQRANYVHFQLHAKQCTARHTVNYYVNKRVQWSAPILHFSTTCHAAYCKTHCQLLSFIYKQWTRGDMVHYKMILIKLWLLYNKLLKIFEKVLTFIMLNLFRPTAWKKNTEVNKLQKD